MQPFGCRGPSTLFAHATAILSNSRLLWHIYFIELFRAILKTFAHSKVAQKRRWHALLFAAAWVNSEKQMRALDSFIRVWKQNRKLKSHFNFSESLPQSTEQARSYAHHVRALAAVRYSAGTLAIHRGRSINEAAATRLSRHECTQSVTAAPFAHSLLPSLAQRILRSQLTSRIRFHPFRLRILPTSSAHATCPCSRSSHVVFQRRTER
jgi:hypothetical protein